jgi:hypothetical protein
VAWLQGGIELFLARWHYILFFVVVQALVTALTLGILAGPLSVGLFRILDRMQDEPDYRPQIRDLFSGMDRFVDSVVYFFIWAVGVVFVIQFLIFVPVIGVLASVAVVLLLLPLAQFGFPLIGVFGYDWRDASRMLIAGLAAQPVMLPAAGWLFALLPLAGALFATRVPLVGLLFSLALSGVTLSSVSYAIRWLEPWLSGAEEDDDQQ